MLNAHGGTKHEGYNAKKKLKNVTKNSTIKRNRFGAQPPRHMMFEQRRASINEKTHALALRDRALGALYDRKARIEQNAKQSRRQAFILRARLLRRMRSRSSRPYVRSHHRPDHPAHRSSMRFPLRQPLENSENAYQNN